MFKTKIMRRLFPGISLLFAFWILAGQVIASSSFSNLATDSPEAIEDHFVEGKWTIVMIWASYCEICEAEIGSYQEFHRRKQTSDAKVLGVSMDGNSGKADALEFLSRHGIKFDNLIAEPEVVAGYFEMMTGSRWIGTPTFMVFAPNGELLAKQVGRVETELIEAFIAAH